MGEETATFTKYRCRLRMYKTPGVPIVFLHGYSFTCNVWQQLHVLDACKEKGIPFLALDMPYGLKSRCNPKTRDALSNITLVKEAVTTLFGLDKLVLVGASLGGYIALRYAVRYSVSGLCVIAPVRSHDKVLVQHYERIHVPVSIIYGTRDQIVSLEEMRMLATMFPHTTLRVYEGAGHPAYLHQPNRFTRDMFTLYRNAVDNPIP